MGSAPSGSGGGAPHPVGTAGAMGDVALAAGNTTAPTLSQMGCTAASGQGGGGGSSQLTSMQPPARREIDWGGFEARR